MAFFTSFNATQQKHECSTRTLLTSEVLTFTSLVSSKQITWDPIGIASKTRTNSISSMSSCVTNKKLWTDIKLRVFPKATPKIVLDKNRKQTAEIYLREASKFTLDRESKSSRFSEFLKTQNITPTHAELSKLWKHRILKTATPSPTQSLQ